MSWRRAKTLLVLLFLAINIILGYFNFVRPHRIMALRGGNEDVYQSAVASLLQKGIVLNIKPETLPERVAPLLLHSLSAADVAYSLAERFFSEPPSQARLQTLSGGEIRRYVYKQEVLEIAPGGRWAYRRALDADKAEGKTSYLQAVQVAEAFMQQHDIEKLFAVELRRDVYTKDDANAEHTIVWQQTHKGKPIFDAQLSVTVRGATVVGAASSLHRIISETEAALWTSSAGDVLLGLGRDDYLLHLVAVAQAAQRQLVISSLELGLFTNFAASGDDSDSIANPTWRVLLDSGETLYYDALNGKRVYP